MPERTHPRRRDGFSSGTLQIGSPLPGLAIAWIAVVVTILLILRLSTGT